MGFWLELANIVAESIIVIAGSQKINEWLKLDLDDAETAIKHYAKTASKGDIQLIFNGFVHLCVTERDSKKMKKLLLLYRFFCVYTATHF